MSASPAYRLIPGEPLPEGLRRVARGRIDHALDELRGGTDSSPQKAVHEARKDMKKLRALLRLARPALGESAFRRENERFRDAGRELAGAREADVMLETLAALELEPALRDELRGELESRDGGEGAEQARTAAAARAVAMLVEARGGMERWPLEGSASDLLWDGLERGYRRGRRELAQVRAEPSVERLHEWRKRVKLFRYHSSILSSAWPPVMGAFGDEAGELSDLLGEDHDLAELAAWARSHGHSEPALHDAVERRRGELQLAAIALGRRLYAEKPSAHVRRLRRVWRAEACAPERVG